MRRKKKGSAAFMVVMLMTIILILTFSLIPLTLSSVKQSKMLYGRNRTYYTGEGNMDKMLHYIDVFSERARISAYNKCFKDGGPNLNTSYVYYIYRKYIPDEEDVLPELTYEEFKEKLINYYKYEFNKGIIAFFDSDENKSISITEPDITSKSDNVIYSWNSLQSSIDEYTLNEESSKVNVEAFNNVKSESEFYRLLPKLDVSEESKKKILEFSNIQEEGEKIKNIDDRNDLIYEYTAENLLRETFYISSLNKDKTKRCLSVTMELDPLGCDIAIEKEGNKKKKHDALTYGIICEDNLIAQNNLTINSSVIVGGQGVPSKESSIDSVEYGGIIAGVDTNLLRNIDGGLIGKVTPGKDGKITIEKDAFVGELDSENIHGGFIEILSKESLINIKGNSYSHSIVTHEESLNGRINIGKSAFVADNVSLNGSQNNINIKNHLIGFEDGASMSSNHLSSPAIVINKRDKLEEGKLKIGGQVALAGEGFVENLIGEHEGKAVLFKTFETTAIYPNYIAYSEYLSATGFEDFYKQYQIKEKENQEILPIDMFDKYSVMSGKSEKTMSLERVALKGIKFILSYFVEYKDQLNNYDFGKDSIIAEGIKLDETLNQNMLIKHNNIEDVARGVNGEDGKGGINISYFNYILYSNGKMYLTRNPDDNALLENAKNAIVDGGIGEDIVLPKKEYSPVDISGQLNSNLFPNIKTTLINRLNLIDVVKDDTLRGNGFYSTYKDKTRLDRCFAWDKLNGDIKIGNKDQEDVFIRVSKNTIELSKEDVEALKRKTAVFIASEGDVIIDTNENININGCIVAKGNVITSNNDITITANEETASNIASFENVDLQEFLSPGLEGNMVEGITRTVKTNLNIINRRQILE